MVDGFSSSLFLNQAKKRETAKMNLFYAEGVTIFPGTDVFQDIGCNLHKEIKSGLFCVCGFSAFQNCLRTIK